MKKHLLSLLFLLAATFCVAQTARKFTVNITSDGKANMVAYLPASPTGRAVVGCPGGGYSHLSMQNEGHDWAEFFNRQGIAYFVLTYRMPHGDRTIPVGDACQAVRTVRDSAAQWSINPRDVGIMGFSAGGHLASTVSTHAQWAERPDFTILFYPVISMVESETHRGSLDNFLGQDKKNKDIVRQFSNHRAVRRHLTPPAIILMANDDRAVPPVTNGIAYYSAMRKAGNHCTLHVYDSGGHGFGMRTNFKYHDQMISDLTNWLHNLPAVKPEAVRVACIGNSITDGMGIDCAEYLGYPAIMQRQLGSAYDVRNFGVSSRTMLQKGDYPYVKEKAWRDALSFIRSSQHSADSLPDVVVIKLGTNDSKPHNWQHKAEFEQDLQQMIDSLNPLVPVLNKKGKPTKKMQRSASPRIFLCTPIPAAHEQWGITDSVIVNEVIPMIENVARKNNLPVIDLHSQFDVKEKDFMQRDGIHPTERGAYRMAEIIAGEIKKESSGNK